MKASSQVLAPSDAVHSPPVGRFERLAGTRLFVDKRGSGNPAVVFLPGAGLSGLDYWPLHERVASITTSVVYDRAGTGFSDRVGLPRSARAVTDELHALLGWLGAGPALLVGHSLGGLYARHYAQRYPAGTRGLLLLDPAHEHYDAYMPPQLTAARKAHRFFSVLNTVMGLALRTGPTQRLLQKLPAIRRYQALYRSLFEAEMIDWPVELRSALVPRHVSLEWLAVGLRESQKLNALYAEIEAAGPLPDVPLIIFGSTGTDGFSEAVATEQSKPLMQAEIEGRLRLYSDFAAAIPRAEVRRVDAGHVTLPFRQVGAIAEAIQQLIGQTRR
jgi:pimeloyl-ACP methyl ester carboxylesterase